MWVGGCTCATVTRQPWVSILTVHLEMGSQMHSRLAGSELLGLPDSASHLAIGTLGLQPPRAALLWA